MIPINDVERINKGDFLYAQKGLSPYVVAGFSKDGLDVRNIRIGGIINHANIMSPAKLLINNSMLDELNIYIKFVKPNNLARLEKGSIITDLEGVLNKGKNREWMVLIPAENKSYHMGMKKMMGASNYVLVPINKKTGKPMLESTGVGARSLHRSLKNWNKKGFISTEVVMQKDDEGNLYMIDPTEHEAFRESLEWNNWEK